MSGRAHEKMRRASRSRSRWLRPFSRPASDRPRRCCRSSSAAGGGAPHHALPALPARPRLGAGRGAASDVLGRAYGGRSASPSGGPAGQGARHHRRPARAEDATQRAGHGHPPARRLPHRESRLREPPRPARHGPSLRARRCGGPPAAVLVACGHAPLGKAHPGYQELSARLARRGYVVLCFDPVGQGERSQFWDAARGRSRYNLVCGEHAVLGNLCTSRA